MPRPPFWCIVRRAGRFPNREERHVTFEELGSLGELIAAIATVVTLAYLATQIRYARLAASDTSRHSRADGVREILTLIIENPEARLA
jgi:hypothetical protein